MSRASADRPAGPPVDRSVASAGTGRAAVAPAPVGFSERLVPGPGGWTAVILFAVVLGAGIVPASATAGYVVGAVVLALGAALAWAMSPQVRVTGSELSAGRAHIPRQDLGEVVVLDRAAVSEQMGPAWDPRAFACLRTFTGGAVRIEVTDPQDPTPYWIVSSRRPDELAAALRRRG